MADLSVAAKIAWNLVLLNAKHVHRMRVLFFEL